MTFHDMLADKTKQRAVLVNCEYERDRLLCGLAIFRGGLNKAIEVFAPGGGRGLKIMPPDSVKTCTTRVVLTSPIDDIEIPVLNDEPTQTQSIS